MQGAWPLARCSQAAAACGRSLYLQGGSYYKADGPGLDSLDDLWSLDTGSRQWQQLDCGRGPSARNAGVMVLAAASQQLVHHGGWLPFKETYSDTWVLQL